MRASASRPYSEDAGSAPFSGGEPGPAGGPRNPPPSREPLALHPVRALLTVSVLFAVAGAVLLILTPSPRRAGGNQAFTNAAGTRQVAAAVAADLKEIYSYTYTDLSATTDRARQVLTGQAAAQYAELQPALSGAVAEKLTVSTTVASIGVRTLTPDSATLLVFLTQHTTRAGKPQPAADGQLQVTARREHGRWLITTISAR